MIFQPPEAEDLDFHLVGCWEGADDADLLNKNVGLLPYKVWVQCRCSSTRPMTLENVLLDISKTLTASSNSDCLVLSGSRWSCWVFQTEVPVPCGCPRSAEAGGSTLMDQLGDRGSDQSLGVKLAVWWTDSTPDRNTVITGQRIKA